MASTLIICTSDNRKITWVCSSNKARDDLIDVITGDDLQLAQPQWITLHGQNESHAIRRDAITSVTW